MVSRTSAVETGRPPGSGRSQSPRGRLRSRPPEISDVEPPPSRLSACAQPSATSSVGELHEREAGVVGARGRRRRRRGARRRRRPSAARGWRPSVMSESNWRGAGREALGRPRARTRRAAGHEQRAGLQQVPARRGAERVAAAIARRRPATCTHARTSPQGASKGTWRRATPRVRSSPSGRPSGRTKKPPTIASATPRARAPGRQRAWPRRTTTRSSVPRRVVAADVDGRRAAVGEADAQPAVAAGRSLERPGDGERGGHVAQSFAAGPAEPVNDW